MNPPACSRKPARTVIELASAHQHQKPWPIIMERAVEGESPCHARFSAADADREQSALRHHRTFSLNSQLHLQTPLKREQTRRIPARVSWVPSVFLLF
jgi:hypothetical protein